MKIEIETGEIPEKSIPALTDEEVRDYARSIITDRAFASWMVDERDSHLVPTIFMPLMFLDDMQRKAVCHDKALHAIGMMNDAVINNVNGYPIFMACRVVGTDDANKIHAMVARMATALDLA